MTRTTLLAAVALALLAYFAGRRSASDPATIRALRATVDSLTQTRPRFVAQQARTDTVVAGALAQAAQWRRVADSLEALVPDRPVEAPRRPVVPSEARGGTPTPTDPVAALHGALTAERRASAALQLAVDSLTAARDSALARLAVAEAAARTGVAAVIGDRSWRFGPVRLPRVPKWVAGLVGCAAGGYLDREEPARGCGLGGAALLLAVPTR